MFSSTKFSKLGVRDSKQLYGIKNEKRKALYSRNTFKILLYATYYGLRQALQQFSNLFAGVAQTGQRRRIEGPIP